MDMRAAKLALARKKLKDHQDKKLYMIHKDEENDTLDFKIQKENNNLAQPLVKNEDNDNHTSYDINNDSTHELNKQEINKPCEEIDNNKFQNKLVEPDVNVTEILISNKRNLELQINDLQSKLSQLEYNHSLAVQNYNTSNQKINYLENKLTSINERYTKASEDVMSKELAINELTNSKLAFIEEKSNLQEQLEFTKSILTAKEAENDSLHGQLFNLQNQFEVTQLQLQQVTSGFIPVNSSGSMRNVDSEQNEALLQKISTLEQQLKALQKDRDQINIHYEHYVRELNEQLKSVVKKNEELTREVDNLSNRENNLVDQISEMEIRIQNFYANEESQKYNVKSNAEDNKLQQNYDEVQENMRLLQTKYDGLQKVYAESKAKVEELQQLKETECNHGNISLSKLSADITSDKVAAQRATEQNKKLKQDMQALEDDFVKMSGDKLELTEKLTAEKYLNRELTIKLAEIEEKAKDMYITLKAKDEEMIRLQSSYRDIEKKYAHVSQEITQPQKDDYEPSDNSTYNKCSHTNENESTHSNSNETCVHDHNILNDSVNGKNNIPKEDAMTKLQERFLKIMGEVADLSDEKHRLEHIILQLQNETDTICEYVALYQQQRSLLKRRDEERSAQLKIFQAECDKLKSHVEELTRILLRFSEDKELSSYFEVESRHADLEKVMNLLSNLKNNSLIDAKKKNIDFKNFYPCSCCSGKLIEV